MFHVLVVPIVFVQAILPVKKAVLGDDVGVTSDWSVVAGLHPVMIDTDCACGDQGVQRAVLCCKLVSRHLAVGLPGT